MSAAKAWHLVPSAWRSCSLEDRAEMMAHDLIVGTREGYLTEKMQEEAERKNDKPNAIAEMRKQMLKRS